MRSLLPWARAMRSVLPWATEPCAFICIALVTERLQVRAVIASAMPPRDDVVDFEGALVCTDAA